MINTYRYGKYKAFPIWVAAYQNQINHVITYAKAIIT